MSENTVLVIERSKALVEALEEVLTTLTFARLPRERLEQAREQARAIVATLEDVHDNFAPLIVKKNGRPLTAARNAWNALAAGLIDAKALEVQRLVSTSPSLASMFRGGVDFQDFYRYSRQEIELAADLGQRFDDLHEVWDDFRLNVGRGETGMPFKQEQCEKVAAFLGLMRKHKVIESYTYWKYLFRDETWEEVKKPDGIRFFKNPRLSVSFTNISRPLMGSVNGHWLTAFTYQIIEDHLSRNNLDFEIYSQVRYQTAHGGPGVRGDFDVLARSSSRILLVECKAGRLRGRENDNRQDFEELANKAEMLTKALKTNRAEETDITFWLVFNPRLNAEEHVSAELKGSLIQPLAPQQIRGRVIEHFRGG